MSEWHQTIERRSPAGTGHQRTHILGDQPLPAEERGDVILSECPQALERIGYRGATVTLSGTFDLTTGEFSVAGPVTDSSGKLAGAFGDLTFEGVQDVADPTGAFTETVTGEICVDLGSSE